MAVEAGRVQPGQAWKPSAARENRWSDAADRVLPNSYRGLPIDFSRYPAAIARVKNNGILDMKRGYVMEVKGTAFEPATSDNAKAAFWQEPILLAEQPNTTDFALSLKASLAVCLEPIPMGAIGRCVVDGYTPVNIQVHHTQHRYAIPTNGNARYLDSHPFGVHKIVWKEDGTGVDKLAYVHLHGGVGDQVSAKITTTITGRSGNTPGAGKVVSYYMDSAGTLVEDPRLKEFTCYNWTQHELEAANDAYCWVEMDPDGNLWITAQDCPEGTNYETPTPTPPA